MPGRSQAGSRQQLLERLRDVGATNQKLRRGDFSLSNATANQRSKIAEYQPDLPIAFRPDTAARMAFVTVEEFQTDTTGGNSETFNLSHNIIETSNTENLVLYDSGVRVQPDSVDYAANSFTYTNPDASADYLHAFYVPRDPVQVEIVKKSPRSQGGVEYTLFDDATSLLHERNQNKEPPTMDFDDPLAGVVPPRWKVQIYVDGPVPFEWDDSSEANSQSTTATNAIVSLPVRRASESVDGLSQAVKRSILER